MPCSSQCDEIADFSFDDSNCRAKCLNLRIGVTGTHAYDGEILRLSSLETQAPYHSAIWIRSFPSTTRAKKRAGLQAGGVSRNAGATNTWSKIINEA